MGKHSCSKAGAIYKRESACELCAQFEAAIWPWAASSWEDLTMSSKEVFILSLR